MARFSFGCGESTKRCPKCQLVTSYDVSPAEAAAIKLEEPDWRGRFEEHANAFPKLPDYLAWDSAYERTLRDWRRWHDKADVYTGMAALTRLDIFPARSLLKHIPRDDKLFEEQHDAHMWLIMSQRAWRIVAIEDRTMVLDSFGEQTQVDLSRAKWGNYIEKAAEVLMAKTPQ